MSLFSNSFLLFVGVCVLVYYIAPKRTQWIVLLVFSYMYYMFNSVPATLFLVYSTLVTYGCGLWLQKAGEKEKENQQDGQKSHKKSIIVLGLILNLGMLAILKYTNFFIGNFNLITDGNVSLLNLILPLGISYYTFQSAGYLLDVYWGRAKAEKNLFKMALFVSFFPQLIQGPISRYGRLGAQLYAEHQFDIKNIKYGAERMIWGFFKKMILSDWAAVYADAIFKNPDEYSGIAIFGVLLYSIQLYGDFSGGIDIIIGVANMFGITMDENFKRPFFSKSIGNFWQRWHITLGSWMKDYLFYPLTLSKAMRKCGKVSKKLFGKKTGRNVPICLTNLVVFFVVGIWHGATWSNIGWGLYNGAIIAFSGLCGDGYKLVKKKLHINDKAIWYQLFMIIRTFILVNISWYFECVDSFGTALRMMRYSVTQFNPSQFLLISSGKLGTEFTPYALAILVVGCLILFVVGVVQEKGIRVRETLVKAPFIIEFAVCLAFFILIPLCAPMAAARGFIYAQF